ncbi:Na+ channel auxiliary subunit TipE, partial [Trinorchestia longiramus]
MLVPTQQILKGGSSPTPVVHNDQGKPQTAKDREKLDAGRKALKELLQKREQKKNHKRTCTDILRLYTTVLGGLMVVLGLFVFLFLVPMTIDPALATLTFEFNPKPSICMITSFSVIEGLSNTSWCSCLEGCTSDVFRCYQIEVAYREDVGSSSRRTRSVVSEKPESGNRTAVSGGTRRLTNQTELSSSSTLLAFSLDLNQQKETVPLNYSEYVRKENPTKTHPPEIVLDVGEELKREYYPYDDLNEDDLSDYDLLDDFPNFIADELTDPFNVDVSLHRRRRAVDLNDWDVTNASLFVNVKGCGYPPDVNCTVFEMKYSKVGRRFYCHFSQLNPYLVLDEYDPEGAAVDLYYSIGLPFASIIGGSILMCLMQTPYRKLFRRIRRRRIEN